MQKENEGLTLQYSSVAEIIENSNPSLAKIRNLESKETVLGLIDSLIFETNKLLNVPMLSNGQISKTSEILFKEFFWMKLDDFRLCFYRGLTSQYGQIYNRLDISVLSEWLNAYREERQTSAEQTNENKHLSSIDQDGKIRRDLRQRD